MSETQENPNSPRRQVKSIADVALEVCHEQGEFRVWYGNPSLCHAIYNQSGRIKAYHPLNVISSVVGVYLGRKYPVYEPDVKTIENNYF